jgi:hypothetical protein
MLTANWFTGNMGVIIQKISSRTATLTYNGAASITTKAPLNAASNMHSHPVSSGCWPKGRSTAPLRALTVARAMREQIPESKFARFVAQGLLNVTGLRIAKQQCRGDPDWSGSSACASGT